LLAELSSAAARCQIQSLARRGLLPVVLGRLLGLKTCKNTWL
jgi:hypothetical protein